MPQRREPRITDALSVWVTGRDVNGNRFEQSAKVVDVSRLGGRLAGIRCLRGPGETLEVRHRGKKAQFCVVWVDETEGQVGLRCAEPEKYIWGVALPLSTPRPHQPEASTVKTPVAFTASPTTPVASLPDAISSHPQSRPAGESQQRKHPRHRCVGGIEVRRPELQQRVWGRLAQLSEGGCYVESLSPLPADSHVELLLGAAGVEVRCKGVVCYSRPGIGMGIMFTELAEDCRHRLQALVADLGKGGRFSRFA
jgi:PilZ domain